MRHLLEPTNLSVEEIDILMERALDIIAHREKYAEVCKGKKLATLFYEPSTRTRLSFTAAMMELGGNVLGFSDANSSSVSKGETIADTIRVVSCFADIVAMRHPKEGAPWIAKNFSGVPVINAGDGGHNHPTQTLTDMLTIKRELGHFDHLTIGLCGDLKYGRTVHSLIKAMSRYEGVKFVLISPKELQLPSYMIEEMQQTGIPYEEVNSIEAAMPELDVLYMTRVQQERFANKAEYERLKLAFVLDEEKMKLGKEKMIVLHPLPRVGEITEGVDNDPRAAYFRQVENGKFVRMSLIYTLLQWKDQKDNIVDHEEVPAEGKVCQNPHCITSKEPVAQRFYLDEKGVKRCVYCDHEV